MKTSVRKIDTIITVLLSLAIAGAAILSYAFVRVRAQEGAQPQASAISRAEIVFAKRSNGSDYNIFSVSPDGTGVCSPGNAISACPIVQGPISNQQTPALSPDGNKLAYAAQPPFDAAGKLQLHILDLTTGNDTQLTSNPDDNAYPAWSPDGTRIAFMRGNLPLNDLVFSSTTSQIWIIPAAGGAPTQFTPNGTNHVTPAWSPKAGQNVLALARKSTTSGKYFLEQAIVNSDNTIGTLKAFTNLSPNSTSDGNNLFPAWSADGNRIAFNSDRINLGDAIGDIWILDAAAATGSTDAPVTQFTTSSPQFDIQPVWSPDGTQIAWVRGALGSVDPGTFDLWRQGVDASSHPTGAAVNITSGFNEPQTEHSQPTWRAVGANPTPTPTPTPLVCASGFANCNGVDADGCEININTDNNNCGSCGHTCAPGTHCTGGGCVSDPAATLTFDGRLRDRVSRNDNGTGLDPDGDPDGTFTMTLPPATSSKAITKIALAGPNGDVWDTVPNNGLWTVGVARSLDGQFENQTGFDGHLEAVPVGNTGVFKLFIASAIPDVFTQGSSFTATVTFTDASTLSGSVTLTRTAAVDLSIVNLTTNPSSATQGQAIAYQVRVLNNGTELATGVKLTHPFVTSEVYESGGVSNNSGSVGICTPDTAKVLCTAINLGPGEDATFTVIVHFRNASAPSAGHAAFTASSTQTDANVNDNTGQITVPLGTLPRPPNDDIASASTIINDIGTTTGNNLGGTRQSDLNLCAVTACIGIQNPHQAEAMHAGQFGDSSSWYKWIAPSNGPVDFNTFGSKFNTLLGVYTFEDGYFTEVASNDDAVPGFTWSKVHFDAAANKTYYIAVDGFLGAAGDLSLSWNHSVAQPAPVTSQVTNICGGEHSDCPQQPGTKDNPNPYPAFVCTAGSTDPDFCPRDLGGFTVITIKGTNFTTDSQVIMKGAALKGFLDKAGTQPIGGATTFINNTTLVAHIPPYPQLTKQDLAEMRVYTFTSAATAKAFMSATLSDSAAFPDPGTYRVSENIAMLGIIEVQNLVIPPGTTRSVCGNVPNGTNAGEQTCMDFINFGPGSTTVRPSWFAQSAYCDRLHYTLDQCIQYGEGPQALDKLMHLAFAINFTQPVLSGTINLSQSFQLTPGAVGIASGATLIASGGGNVIAQGGGNVIAQGGGNVIAAGGGNVIAQGGGNLIAAGGGNVIAQGGGNLIAQGGGNIIAAGGGNLIAQGGGNVTRHDDDSFVTPANSPPIFTAADLQNGSRGWFVASSSGGNAPTIDVTNNLDGTVTGTLHITFDQSSSPRVQDLQGLVFTVVANPAVLKFASSSVTVNEADGRALVTLTRTGDTTNAVAVSYATSDGTATVKTDYMPVFGSVTFNPGETQKTVTIPLIDNGYGPGSGAQRSFNLTIGNTIGGAIQMPNVATIIINNNDAANLLVNPLDNSDARFFVRQHYLDFLTREPDASGQDFWANNIASCGSDGQCLEVKRINASAAFFLSIEFQEEGYLAERTYKAAFGDATGNSGLNGAHTLPVPMIRFNQFLADAQEVGQGVIVNQGNWQQQLNDNKNAYMLDFVQRQGFVNAYPVTMTTADFVNNLFKNVGVTPSAAELSTALGRFGGAANSSDVAARAQALRDVAENPTLIQQEKNRGFVLMQYFGYLRRNPNEGQDIDYTGYDFWLRKLNQFNGNSVDAEMVKAFISSGEYRQRFAP